MADAPSAGAGSSKSGLKKIFHPFNHKFSEKVEEIQEKLEHTKLRDAHIKAVHVKHKVGKFTNIFNANHRHDEEHEIATDNKRSRVAENHRFNSFAPEREGNLVKWYVDGRDYFWVRAIHHQIDQHVLIMHRLLQRLWSKPRRPSTLPIGGSLPSL
jgi:phospholipase D1/2